MAALASGSDDPDDSAAQSIYGSLFFADAALNGAEPLRIREPEVERSAFDQALIDRHKRR